ncbi:hypothetical protein ACFLS1_05800, partial [Verrucomicrobiota bacterium]
CSVVSADDPSFTKALRDGAAVAGCLSARESFVRWLEAPFSSVHKARKVLPTLLDVQIPFAVEECIYSFLNISSQETSTHALAIAARSIDIEKKIAVFQSQKLNPFVLDHEGLALWTQSLRAIPVAPPSDTPRIVFYLGADHSTIVMGHGEKFLSAHNVRHNDIGQIKRLLKAAFQPSTLSPQPSSFQWIWTGPGAKDLKLVESLLDQIKNEWPVRSITAKDPETFLARALAIRALLPGPLRCNLRASRHIHPKMERKAAMQSYKTSIILLLAGVLLCTVSQVWNIFVKRKESQIDRVFSSMADKLSGYHLEEEGHYALKTVKRKINEQAGDLQPFIQAFEPSLTATILAISETGNKHNLCYEMVSLDKTRVIISGTANDWKVCDELVTCLEHAGYSVNLTRKNVTEDGQIPFTVTTEKK